jgi:hypothetical protein
MGSDCLGNVKEYRYTAGWDSLYLQAEINDSIVKDSLKTECVLI